MAHSCSPNTLYDGNNRRFVAVKNIPRDAPVTFSYNAALYMVHSSEVRQTVLRQSHLFVCKCPRCVGVDHTRGIRCPCGKGETSASGSDDATRFRDGTRALDEEKGLYDRAAWACKGCGGSFSDADMGDLLAREETIEREVHALEQLRGTVEKGQYERLKQVTEKCTQTLSRDHWCYLKTCYLLSHYHYQLARRTRTFAADLLRLAVLWGKKYAAGLVRTKTAEHAPMLFVEWAYWLSMVCGEWPHLLQEKVTLLEAAYPTYSTIYPEDPETKKIAATLEAAQARSGAYKNKTFLGKAYKSLNYDYDESELFDKWEELLANKYMDTVKSNPNSGFERLLKEGTLEEATTS